MATDPRAVSGETVPSARDVLEDWLAEWLDGELVEHEAQQIARYLANAGYSIERADEVTALRARMEQEIATGVEYAEIVEVLHAALRSERELADSLARWVHTAHNRLDCPDEIGPGARYLLWNGADRALAAYDAARQVPSEEEAGDER